MATSSKAREVLTLEEFLRLPGIDENPGKEYVDGRIEAKVAAQKKHSLIQLELGSYLNTFARPGRLGLAFLELRCTFAGRSILPDVAFLRREKIRLDDKGEPEDETTVPPDVHVEIISPDRRVRRSRAKLEHSTANGCSLGLLIHPYRGAVEVFRPGVGPESLLQDGMIVGDPILPGLCLPVREVFGWLRPMILRPEVDAK